MPRKRLNMSFSLSRIINGERGRPDPNQVNWKSGDRMKTKAMNQYEQEKKDLEAERYEIRMLRDQSAQIISNYKKDYFCDVDIKANDDVVVKAHKMMLAINSHYFNKMFKPGGDWEKLTEVTISEFDGVVMRVVVDSIYYQRVKRSLVTKENAKQMLKAGILFETDIVKEEAAYYMSQHLDENNAIDLLHYDIFTGKMANSALKYIGEHFQVFMDNAELKKRLLTEMNVDTLINLLQCKFLMLWHPNGIYLEGIEREKKIFYFVMAYVSHDKEVRLPELSRLLKALKLPILAATKVLNVQIMGEGLKVAPEELSGQLADVLEPFDDITGKENLSTMFVTEKTSKDKARSATATRALAETCKMRFATLPHSTSCSDLILPNTPLEERVTYCPEKPTDNTVIYSSTKMIKSITICKPNIANWKADAQTDVSKELKKLLINGIRIKWDDDSEESLGSKDSENNMEETYTLDEGVLITEMMTYHTKGFFSVARHEFSILTEVHDVAFMTNKEKCVGPMRSSLPIMDLGLRLKVPTKVRSLESGSNGCPQGFFWLQGFGLEELKDGETSSHTNCFYPIWGFQTHFKCYELGKQEFEFVAGIRKCYQFSVEGISEYPMINTTEDINCIERTPVHEVVDLGDSDDEEPQAGPSNMNDDSIMMIDSDSEHTEDGSEEEEEDSDDDEFDDEDNQSRLLRAGILEVESGEDVGHGTDSPFNADILDEDDEDEDVDQSRNMSSELIEIPSSSEPDVDPPNMKDVSEDVLDDETEIDNTEKKAEAKDKTVGTKSPSKVVKKKKSSEEDTVEISKIDDNEEKAEDNKSAKGKSKKASKEEDTVEISKMGENEEKEEGTESAKDESKKSCKEKDTSEISKLDTNDEKADDTKTVKGKGKGKASAKTSTNQEKEETNSEIDKKDTEKEKIVEEKPDDSKLSRSKRGKITDEEKKDKESDAKKETKGKKNVGKDAETEATEEKESPSKKKEKGKAIEEKAEEPKSAKRSRGRNSATEEKEEEAKTSKRKKR